MTYVNGQLVDSLEMNDPLFEHFNQLLVGQKALKENTIIEKYFGVVDETHIHEFAVQVEEELLIRDLSKTVIKRAFLIVIESLQNIFNHGNRGDRGTDPLGGCVVSETDQLVKITILNRISEAEANNVVDFIDKINPLEEEQLKNKYLRTLANGQFSKKHGAGLGLITIRLKSGNPIVYNLIGLEKGYFAIMLVASIPKRFP